MARDYPDPDLLGMCMGTYQFLEANHPKIMSIVHELGGRFRLSQSSASGKFAYVGFPEKGTHAEFMRKLNSAGIIHELKDRIKSYDEC